MLMQPIGWPTVLLMFIGTAAIAATTRPQEGNFWDWRFAAHDLRYFADANLWTLDWPLITWTDYLYVGGLVIWCTVIAVGVVRLLLNCTARLVYRPPVGVPMLRLRAAIAGVLMAMVTVVCIGTGWSFRLGSHWAAEREAGMLPARDRSQIAIGSFAEIQKAPTPPKHRFAHLISRFPTAIEDDDVQRALWSARKHGDTKVRLGTVALLVEGHATSEESLRQLRDSATTDPDVGMRGCALRLLGLLRHPDDVRLLVGALDSPHPGIREAAAEGLALGRDVNVALSRVIQTEFGYGTAFKHGPVTMIVGPVMLTDTESKHALSIGVQGAPWSSDVAPRLIDRVINGATPAERDAAANALAVGHDFRPRYRFRFSEWGIWQEGVPPTAFDVSPARSLLNVPGATAIRTPQSALHVVHVTVDQPLIADVTIETSRGGISHAFPIPDETSNSRKSHYGSRAVQSKDPFAGRRDPYAFLPEQSYYLPPAAQDLIMSSGFRWRSLIMLPQKASWMTPPGPEDDPLLAWWSRQRAIDCAWISSRDDSDQFLYYRSHTRLDPCVSVSLGKDEALTIGAADVDNPVGAEDQPDFSRVTGIESLDQTARRGRRTQRRGMYVTVAGGKVSIEIVPVPASGKKPESPAHTIGTGEVVRGDARQGSVAEMVLRGWVIDAGLSSMEADARLITWRKPFFQTDGKRFILLLSAVDYDSLCPISISPKPTEMARVGLVWTELGEVPQE